MATYSLHSPRALLPDGWRSDVRITIEDGVIQEVEWPVAPVAGDQRLTDRALLPAPSNLHSHGFQRAMAGRNQHRGANEDSFWSWRELMYRFLGVLSPDMVHAITAMAQMEMAEAGYAAVGEFHYLHHAEGAFDLLLDLLLFLSYIR